MHKHRILAAVLALPVLCLATGASAASNVEILGTTASNEVRLDGYAVPSGTTLVSPSVVASAELPALVHLRGGHAIALAAGSEALFERSATGGIRLAVKAGMMEINEPGGSLIRLAANESHLLADENQIGEGLQVELVALCTFDDDKEEWVPIKVPASEVGGRLADGDLRAGEDHNDLGLDEDCDEEAPFVLFTTGGKVVTALSGLAVLGLIDENEASR